MKSYYNTLEEKLADILFLQEKINESIEDIKRLKESLRDSIDIDKTLFQIEIDEHYVQYETQNLEKMNDTEVVDDIQVWL